MFNTFPLLPECGNDTRRSNVVECVRGVDLGLTQLGLWKIYKHITNGRGGGRGAKSVTMKKNMEFYNYLLFFPL